MITIISGTNRSNNQTLIFAKKYHELLSLRNIESQVFSLEEMPIGFTLEDIYTYHHPGIKDLIEKYLMPAAKIVIIAPEYNGSIPGVLKVFIDAVKPAFFKDKKVALVGIAEGRAGNLRGMDNLTNILNYLNAEVMSFKLPISKISAILSEGRIVDEGTVKSLEFHIDKLIKY